MMEDFDIIDRLVEASHTAPELCSSCKHLEREVFNNVPEKWCGKTDREVVRVWLCTMYEQKDESEAG